MKFESTERLLRDHPFCSEMTDDQVRFMAGCMRNVRYPAGAYLFREGTAAEALLLLRTGRVALEVHAPGRGAVQLETLGAGDVLGWSVLFPPHVWHVDARAVEPTVVLSFAAHCLQKKIDGDLPFAYVITRRLLLEVHRRLERVRLHQADVYGGGG